MPTLAAVSCCVGLLLCIELTACAQLPLLEAGRASVDRVLSEPLKQREQLWAELSAADPNDPARILLQSLPGHSGYAPAAARDRLAAQLDQGGLGKQTRRLFQLRLVGLQRELILSQLLEEREERLRKLIRIEEQLNNRAHEPTN